MLDVGWAIGLFGPPEEEKLTHCTHLQRELLSERTKVKALSEELENPMNVHRWRKLEGSDPGTLEMIQKIQTLQKRLIAKTGVIACLPKAPQYMQSAIAQFVCIVVSLTLCLANSLENPVKCDKSGPVH